MTAVCRIPATSPLDAAARLARRALERRPPEAMRWGWGDAVLLYGVARLAVVTGDTGLVDGVNRFHMAQARHLPCVDRADTCAPALSALALARWHRSTVGLPAAAHVAEFVLRAPRNRLGSIDHLGTSPLRHLFPSSIWIDSLAMLAVFAAQWGAYVGDAELVDFGAAQPGGYASTLLDTREGLFRHAYLLRFDRAVPHEPVFWLRGNGWAVFAMVEIADELPDRHPAREEIVRLLAIVARALARWQRADGSWGTVINDPRSYAETSGTALCAYALARGAERGWLDASSRRVARAAVDFVGSRIDRDGVLHGSSAATNAMPGAAYGLVPWMRDAPWGVGAFLLAASVV